MRRIATLGLALTTGAASAQAPQVEEDLLNCLVRIHIVLDRAEQDYEADPTEQNAVFIEAFTQASIGMGYLAGRQIEADCDAGQNDFATRYFAEQGRLFGDFETQIAEDDADVVGVYVNLFLQPTVDCVEALGRSRLSDAAREAATADPFPCAH